MNISQWKERFTAKLSIFIAVYLLLSLLLYWIVADDWSVQTVKTDSVSMGYLLPVGSDVSQTFNADMDGLETIGFVPHFDLQERNGTVTVMLLDGENILWTKDIAASELPSDEKYAVQTEVELNNSEKTLTLKIMPNETGMALWAGTTMSAGKFDVPVQLSGLTVSNESYQGSLVLEVQGYEHLPYSAWYWPGALLLLAICVLCAATAHVQSKIEKKTILSLVGRLYRQYKYLLQQLVWRDFRVKYKSSALGMVWSFLNPLLTMLVYLFVFSTLFKSDIEHFPVYLMTGIVMLNYVSESTSLGLSSIIDNGALITKVYMPKVIYPLSKVLSSAINLCISFVPLLIVMLITNVPLTNKLILLPIPVFFLIIFNLGLSLMLSTLNVFFRDTKFLWGVVLTMWNFLTPIFYPESIIAPELLPIYRCNPLYQLVSFMRTIVLDGTAPTPDAYLACILASGIPLLLGLWVFRRNQDRFVLHL